MVGSAATGIGGSAGPAPVPSSDWIDHGRFEQLSRAVQRTFAQRTSGDCRTLFRVKSDDLFDIYLSNLPAEARQHHSCSCCRQFVRRFGGLVRVGVENGIYSVMWDARESPSLYGPAVAALQKAVEARAIEGAEITCESVWGTPKSRDRVLKKTWKHFSVSAPKSLVYDKNAVQTASARAAEIREHRRTLGEAIEEFSIDTARAAANLARSGTLTRSEIVTAPADHFLSTHEEISKIRSEKKRDAYLWDTVASIPPGWCTPKTSMLGTLLKGFADGDSVEYITRTYDTRVDPTRHLRPQAPTTQGNIEQAEKIVDRLGIRTSMRRRHASLSDIRPIWLPTRPHNVRSASSGGIFSGLRTKDRTPERRVSVSETPVRIRWEKFARTVLGQALQMEVQVDNYMNFCGLAAPAVPNSPPILQWDKEEARNPISWYVYRDPSTARQWSLTQGAWVDVVSICLQPSMWGDQPSTHHGQSAILLLKGCRDQGGVGQALFPAILRPELHQVRATIESYSDSHRMHPAVGEEASGVRVADGSSSLRSALIRVTTPTGIQHYIVDSWD